MNRPIPSELQTAAVKGSVWTSVSATVGLPLAIVVNILVARALGPVDFGYLAALMAAYAIATTIANLGVSDATIQWGATAFVRGAKDELVQLVRRCAGYHLVVEMPLIVLATAVMLRNASWETLLVACLAAAFTMAIGTASVVQTLLSRTAIIARVALVTNVALQVSVATAALSSKSGAITWVAGLAAATLSPLALLLLSPPALRSAVLRPMLPNRWPDGFVAYAGKAGIGAVVSILVFSRSEIFVLQAQHLALAAGIYALAFGVAAQLTAPIDAVLGPMLPAAASLVASVPERVAPAILRGVRFTALGAGAIAALGIPAASALISPIYGVQFELASALLLPLALVSCFQSLNHPMTAFLYGMRRVGAVLLINGVAFIVDMGIAVSTIGTLHAWGAVLANAAGQIVSLGGAAILLKRQLSLSPMALLQAMRPFGGGIAGASLGWLAANMLWPTTLPGAGHVALGMVIGGAVFVGVQRLGRPTLTREDVAVLVQAMPKALRRAIGPTLSFLRFAA
jgi:O-antigen/teichoic acid export membrane protein